MSDAAVLHRPINMQYATGAKILIIDDEAAIRESLETLLDLEGFSVFTAEDAESGLDQLAQHSFDLVLLDFALPDRNGLDVLAEIRERNADQTVIMITAYGTVENAVRAVQAGEEIGNHLGGFASRLVFLDVYGEAFDLLIESGEGHAKALGGVGLVPGAFFQHVEDDAALALLHDLEEGSVGG